MSKKRQNLTDNIANYSAPDDTGGVLYKPDAPGSSDIFTELHRIQNSTTDEKNIITHPNGSMTYRGWSITRTGLTPPDNATEDDYAAVGKILLQMDTSMQWLLGDWLAVGDNRQWGETYNALADELGYQTRSLHEYASVCRKVHFSIRMEKLSFGHHQLVAPFAQNPAVQQVLLQGAASEEWSIKQFRETIKTYRVVIDEALHAGWDAQRFAEALANYTPPAQPAAPTPPGDTLPLWASAAQKWQQVQPVFVRMGRGNMPTAKQRDEALAQLRDLQNHLAALEKQLSEL